MSKTRSKLIDYANRESRTVRSFTTDIHFGRQAKHLPGQPNRDPTKSTITMPLPQLQDLLDLKAGTGHWHGATKEVVDFGTVIGNYRDSGTGEEFATTWGTIHSSTKGAHVVPALPRTHTSHGSAG